MTVALAPSVLCTIVVDDAVDDIMVRFDLRR